jgi:hypothetical protein
MPAPATTGQLRTSIQDMQIGDYIASGVTYQLSFRDLGISSIGNEVPLTGLTSQSGVYYFYFIKVAKGLLIADRVIKNSISWDGLNSKKAIQGHPIIVAGLIGFDQSWLDKTNGLNGILRSLTGGVAYADANGNKSTTDLGYGAFPVNNEWDKYIVNFPQELIQSGKTLDDVFHYSNVATWTQDTPSNGITFNNGGTGSSSNRISRGAGYGLTGLLSLSSSTSNVSNGFRPIFEYIES